MTEESETIPRLTKIWAKNLRSIEYLELELSPLTVLVGPNASGKSNIADIPVFVSDAVRNGLDSALAARGSVGIRRNGNNFAVGLSFKSSDSQVDYDFSARIEDNGEYKVRREGASIKTRDPSSSNISIEVEDGRLKKPTAEQIPERFRELLNRSEDRFYADILKIDSTNLAMPFSRISMSFIDFHSHVKAEDLFDNDWIKFDREARKATEYLKEVRPYHIFPNVLRDHQPYSTKYPLAEDGGNLASVLREMKNNRPENFAELISALNHTVPAIVDVDTEHVGRQLIIKFTHESPKGGHTTVLDASQESDGTLRLLGLLVALYQDPPPGFIVIEEPELTIHPGALAYVAELMVEVADRTSLLVTTHSPEFLDMIPVECIRAVEMSDVGTTAGPVAADQLNAVVKKLFTPGEIHSMEGLRVSGRFG